MRLLHAAITVLAAFATLSACTTQDYYNIAQDSARDNCRKIVNPEQQNDCLRKNNVRYESYQKERAAVQGASK